MKATLERLETHHDALIAALDSNDVGAIEAASVALGETIGQLKSIDNWTAEPELKLAAERIGKLAEAAMMRVHVLQDRARRRAEGIAALRGQPAPALYSR
jgi:hypothetical protein